MTPLSPEITNHNVDQICAFTTDTATIEAKKATHELKTRDTAYQWGRGYLSYQFGVSTDLSETIQVIQSTVDSFFQQTGGDLQRYLDNPSPGNRAAAQAIFEKEVSLLSGLNHINSAYRSRELPPQVAAQVDSLGPTIQNVMRRVSEHEKRLRNLPQEEIKAPMLESKQAADNAAADGPLRIHLPPEQPEATPSSLWSGIVNLFISRAPDNRAKFNQIAPDLISRLRALDATGVEGIFRIAPDSGEIATFMSTLDEQSITTQNDVHVLATALKRLMKDTEPPLLVANAALQTAVANSNKQEAAQAVYDLASKGDAAFKAQFLGLLTFLNQVSKNEASRMTPNNLGVVWGPNMVRGPENLAEAARMALVANDAVALLIEHFDTLRK